MIEENLRTSGLPFTVLRPGLFMDDFLGASLPFARPIQNLLDGHRPLVGRLFLATLRAVVPKNSRIPLTTLQYVGRMAAWALGNLEESQGQVFEAIGSNETAEILCALWTKVTGQPISHVPGMKLGLRFGHPKMAELMGWISRNKRATGQLPFTLTTYDSWVKIILSADFVAVNRASTNDPHL